MTRQHEANLIRDKLTKLENKLHQANKAAEELRRTADDTENFQELETTIRAYTVPSLTNWITSSNQPGSVRYLRQALKDLEEELAYIEREARKE